jgi:plasmid stabilization system protein ParE
MPRGDKSAYTEKQKRQAEHIEEGYRSRGVPRKEAERRAWATENKMSGGGRKSGPKSARSASARKAAATRKRGAGARKRATRRRG